MRKTEKLSEAAKWLKKYLSDGEPHNVCDIRTERKKMGFTKTEIKEAKQKLGVVSFNDASLHDTAAQNWFWQLISKE